MNADETGQHVEGESLHVESDDDARSYSPRSESQSTPHPGEADEAADTPEQRRISILRELLRKHKDESRYLKGILDDLRGTDTKPPRAAEWTALNLRSFLNTHFPEEMAQVVKPRKKKEPKKSPKPEAPKPPRAEKVTREEPKEAPKPSPSREIIPLPSQEPPFKKDLTNTKSVSCRVPPTLYHLVEEKVKRDGRRTGGDVASLVKVLLWLYVGAPEEFVEPEYKPE